MTGARPRAVARYLAIGIATWTAAACARHADSTPKAASVDSAAAAPPPQATAPAEPAVTPATLTVADLDLYEKMMHNRIDSLEVVRRNLSQAKTGQDTMHVMAAMALEGPDSLTAIAAGVTPAHLRAATKVIEDALGTLQTARNMSGVGSQMDTTHMTADERAQARALLTQMHANADSTTAQAVGGMAPAVAAALEQRAPRLDSLMIQMVRSGPGGPGN